MKECKRLQADENNDGVIELDEFKKFMLKMEPSMTLN